MPNPERYREFLDPTWTGSLVYRGLADAEELRKVYPGHRALNHPGIMVCAESFDFYPSSPTPQCTVHWEGEGEGTVVNWITSKTLIVHQHCVVYAVSGGKYINVVGAVHDETKGGTIWDGQWNQEVTQNEFLECFVGWDEEFQALIHVCLPSLQQEKVALVIVSVSLAQQDGLYRL